jgi:hypothetical protein
MVCLLGLLATRFIFTLVLFRSVRMLCGMLGMANAHFCVLLLLMHLESVLPFGLLSAMRRCLDLT